MLRKESTQTCTREIAHVSTRARSRRARRRTEWHSAPHAHTLAAPVDASHVEIALLEQLRIEELCRVSSTTPTRQRYLAPCRGHRQRAHKGTEPSPASLDSRRCSASVLGR